MTAEGRLVVCVIGLGGTIAMTSPQPGRAVVPGLTAGQLIDALRMPPDAAVELTVRDLRQVPGAALTIEDVLEVAEIAAAEVAAGVTGIVVLQGTDTIEETSYLLDLGYRGEPPLVVTGAMRNPAAAGADGAANLLDAIHVAASPDARGRGCLVVMGGEVHAAAAVRKLHTTSPAAFTSPNTGPVGLVVEGTPRFLAERRPRVAVEGAVVRSPRVPLVTLHLGDDGHLLRGLSRSLDVVDSGVDPGVDGLVVAALGAGHAPPSLVPVLADLAGRIPVVLASRTGAGPILSRTYGFPGSETDLLGRGLIGAGFLDPYKARVLLHLLLAVGADGPTITRTIAAAGGHPVDSAGTVHR